MKPGKNPDGSLWNWLGSWTTRQMTTEENLDMLFDRTPTHGFTIMSDPLDPSQSEQVLIGNLSDGVRYPVTLKTMPKEEQRAPLLSGGNLTHVAGCDLTFNGVLPEPMLSISNARLDGAQRVADWYEAKIREGVLIINPDYKP